MSRIRHLISLSRDTELEIPILLACFGPMRAGEICGLSMDSIEGNVVHVWRTMYYADAGYGIKDMPKNYSSNRYIQYPDFVTDRIREKGRITSYNLRTLDTHFSAFLKKNGLPHFRFHDLRHWCVSTLHAQGMPDAYIMQRGGWSSDHTLKEVYRHTLQDQSERLTAQAISHFNSFV